MRTFYAALLVAATIVPTTLADKVLCATVDCSVRNGWSEATNNIGYLTLTVVLCVFLAYTPYRLYKGASSILVSQTVFERMFEIHPAVMTFRSSRYTRKQRFMMFVLFEFGVCMLFAGFEASKSSAEKEYCCKKTSDIDIVKGLSGAVMTALLNYFIHVQYVAKKLERGDWEGTYRSAGSSFEGVTKTFTIPYLVCLITVLGVAIAGMVYSEGRAFLHWFIAICLNWGFLQFLLAAMSVFVWKDCVDASKFVDETPGAGVAAEADVTQQSSASEYEAFQG